MILSPPQLIVVVVVVFFCNRNIGAFGQTRANFFDNTTQDSRMTRNFTLFDHEIRQLCFKLS